MILCPHCDGEHLEGLRFQHRSVCDLYMLETQTQQADFERIRATRGRPITRPATPTEVVLLEALNDPILEDGLPILISVTFGGAIWHRTPTTTQETP